MKVESFVNIIGADFYTGVPDSQLKALCDYLMDIYGIDAHHHIIAANEGNCVALAAGYHLATGKIPVVYMQNSGEGNIINPLSSLLHEKVYAIPVIFVIGWRGEPGIHDEPQHLYQGEITTKLLEDMGVPYFIIGKETTENELLAIVNEWKQFLIKGKPVAFVIQKGALAYSKRAEYKNGNAINREEVIRHIIKITGTEPIISTTGKISRELYENREFNQQSHKYDFLTVGSMGHSSSIALGVAINSPDTKIWCIDGDGALLMHMGAMAVIGANAPANMVHIIINNNAHDTVGGMPTVAEKVDIVALAKACNYPKAVSVNDFESLDRELESAKACDTLCLIEVKCAIGAREDLGRPATSARKNKEDFMEYLQMLNKSVTGDNVC